MLSRLVAHLGWADDAALAAIHTCAVPDAAAVRAMAHLVAAEAVWLARIEGRTPTVAVWPALSPDETAALAREVRVGLAELARSADADPNLASRPIRYTNSAGQAFTTRLDDILLHVALHGAYHRGQVAWLLRHGGDVPTGTDYIAYVRATAPTGMGTGPGA